MSTPVSSPAIVFPVQVTPGFKPASIEHLRWDGRPCPCQKDPFKPAWGGGFKEKRGAHDHDAVDIMAAEGTPILAPCDGYIPATHRIKMDGVLKAYPGVGAGTKAGNYFFLFSADGHWLWYGSHLMAASPLKPGDQVKAGDIIGYVGATGNAKSKNGRGCPHLHLALTAVTPAARQSARSLKVDSKASGKVDPVPYLKPLEPK
jgi:murein DD-endopeptidase MepM/ murein hydrolase activator NlpD